MSQEQEIDNLILQIQETECGGSGLPLTGILNLVAPIKKELKSAQVLTLEDRRKYLKLLVSLEREMYQNELQKMGKALWLPTC